MKPGHVTPPKHDIVVVYGPQGCGKSRLARALAQHYGLKHIVDEWKPGDGIPRDESLVLTCADLSELTDGRDRRVAGVRFISFEAALQELRGRRTPSTRHH